MQGNPHPAFRLEWPRARSLHESPNARALSAPGVRLSLSLHLVAAREFAREFARERVCLRVSLTQLQVVLRANVGVLAHNRHLPQCAPLKLVLCRVYSW